MEALSLLKFWKSTATKVTVDAVYDERDTIAGSVISDPLTDLTDNDDDDDSFFELELTSQEFSNSPAQIIPDQKITSEPQSPISVLRSASPKLSVFMFGNLIKKSKKRNEGDEFSDTESNLLSFSPKSNSNSSDLFTVKFKIEDGSIVPKLTRTNSSKSIRSDESSKQRFAKDKVQKYFNFAKPLKKGGDDGGRISVSYPTRTSSFPAFRKDEKRLSSRFNFKSKQFLKSKSSSAVIVSSPVASNDHPCENIEGAILHCKRSIHTPIGQSSLSRCSSDPSYEKSIKV